MKSTHIVVILVFLVITVTTLLVIVLVIVMLGECNHTEHVFHLAAMIKLWLLEKDTPQTHHVHKNRLLLKGQYTFNHGAICGQSGWLNFCLGRSFMLCSYYSVYC